MMNLFLALIMLLFFGVVDVLYPIMMFSMNIQLSDWWLAANLIFAAVEIVCCMIIKCFKESNGKMSKETKQIMQMLVSVVGAVAGASIQMPGMTNGAHSSSTYDEASYGDSSEEYSDDESEG